MARQEAGSVLVCLPPLTVDDKVIFAKNCDRSDLEVQEVVHIPASDHAVPKELECTFISVEQVAHTHSVILSKPAWMWGAEMGTNEHGLCIGYTLVETKNDSCVDQDGLLVSDLIRLSLERSTCAEDALSVMANQLSQHKLSSHWAPIPEECVPASACIIIADRKVVWVLEIAGEFWAALKLTSGVHGFCGRLTIRTEMDKMSEGLLEKVQQKGFWKSGDGVFDFAKIFNKSDATTGFETILEKYKQEGKISAVDMFKLLRDTDHGINKHGALTTVASMVSSLPTSDKSPGIHWFTATPHPHWSMFKPIIFCENVNIGSATLSPTFGDDDPAKVEPRFQREVNRAHLLWEEHEKLVKMAEDEREKAEFVATNMHQLEVLGAQDVEDMVKLWEGDAAACNAKAASIFEHMIDLELNFLK